MTSADLILIICLVIGLVGGLIRGWWRCLIGIVVLAAACLILYFGVFDYAAKWIEYDSLEFISQQFGFNLTFEVQEIGVSLRLTNLQDSFLLLQNFGLDPVYLNATSEGISKSMVALIGFLALVILCLIVSSLLYWILLRWIMPKRIRKGAISAYQNEKFIIPFNMQYGTIIGISKGNWEWNYSLPHGAGRVMSRSQAFKNADLNAFINSMKNVISTSVNAKTLDESPQAYKDPNEILSLIKDQIVIIKKYIPFYVFKGC